MTRMVHMVMHAFIHTSLMEAVSQHIPLDDVTERWFFEAGHLIQGCRSHMCGCTASQRQLAYVETPQEI